MLYEVITYSLLNPLIDQVLSGSDDPQQIARELDWYTDLARQKKIITPQDQQTVIQNGQGLMWSAMPRITSYNVCYTKLLRRIITAG